MGCSYFDPEKNQLPRLPPAAGVSFCNPEIVGMVADSTPPPPRRGFAIREPAPPKEKPPLLGEPSPLVEPTLAASSRSLTAES